MLSWLHTKVRQPFFVVADSVVSERLREGKTVDIDVAIELGRKRLDLYPPGHSMRVTTLFQLVSRLWIRYKQLGKISDIQESIELGRQALALCPPGHLDQWTILNNLGVYLWTAYRQLGGIDDLNEAITLAREALALRQPGDPDWLESLNNLASDLWSRYERLRRIDDLNEAIALHQEALVFCTLENPRRSTFLINLASHVWTRFEQHGEIDDLNGAIVLARDALELCPLGHMNRSTSLGNLLSLLSLRHDRFGEVADLNESIALARDMLVLYPAGHPDRSTSLTRLAHPLSNRYKRLGRMDDLDEAIVLSRDAITLCPPGMSYRPAALDNLAIHLSTRYEQLGGIDELNEAIELEREALSLRPLGHPDRSTSLTSLSFFLFIRYGQLGGFDDLNEAIRLSRDTLELSTPGHPNRLNSLKNLGSQLWTRYKQHGEIEDLKEATVLARDALVLSPPGHPDRPDSLHNLAIDLSTRYDQSGGVDDLNEAIDLAQEALSICPPGHLHRSGFMSNLASSLCARYQQLGGIDDLNEAILLCQDAVMLRPPGHPHRSISLDYLAKCFHIRFTRLGQGEDIQTLFRLYNELKDVSQSVSPFDLAAARAWVDTAEEFHHPTTLSAYETALRLLVAHSAALPSLPQHLALIKSLSSSLAVDAFSACIRNQSPTKAVELLEQGRGVFWSQLGRLRSPLDDVIASGPKGKALANEFTRLASLIRMTLHSSGLDQHDRVFRLNVELQKVATRIRELPAFSQFLLPSLFPDLQRAASDGPVIIVNASNYSCDALVVLADKEPVHIPLLATRKYIQELSSRLRTLTKDARKMDMKKEFMIFLRELWDKLVSHIIDVLQTICPPQSRIWWCPTAEFSLLPLHAAAPFRKNQKNVSDLYISSYTTTLTSLIRARRPSSTDSTTEKRFIAIGQAAAKGAGELLAVGAELANIGQLVDGLATFTCIEGQDACISSVADELGRHEWAHFACHGIPNQEQPFESGFALRDGRFTIQCIIQCELQNPEFAYLSACHTTVGDRESPDEVIHIASAMQFAGFRSVIGTMWAVDDAETTKVTSMFYKLIRDDSGRLDYTRAARALRKTVKTVNMPIDQRILYVHLGA